MPCAFAGAEWGESVALWWRRRRRRRRSRVRPFHSEADRRSLAPVNAGGMLVAAGARERGVTEGGAAA